MFDTPMFDTATSLTLQLAKGLGLYLIAAGLSGLAAPNRWRLVMEDYERSPALIYVTGAFTFIIGVVLVMIHSIWTDALAIIISLVGWIAVVEGALLLAAPEGLMKLGVALMTSPARTRTWGVFALVIGAALLAAGLTGRALVS